MTLLIQFTPEIEAVAPVASCDELGRTTRCYVSGFDRTRVHAVRVVRGEKRCLVADFNGAFSDSRSIAGVVWRCLNNSTVIMENARIQTDQRSTAIDITANYEGCSALKCAVTLDNGEVYMQRFDVSIRGCRWFENETSMQQGPTELTA